MNISTQNLMDLNGSVQLKPGQRMVRVSGSTWMPIGVGGNFMPGGTSGTSAEYYKCASVTPETDAPEGATFTMTYTKSL